MNNLRIAKTTRALSIACVIFLSVSCLRENLSNCSDGVVLKFRQNEAYKPIQANKLSVFIFDSNGLYVCEKSDSVTQIDDNYVMQLPLYSGEYQFVAWVGLSDYYQVTPCIPGQTCIKDFTLQLKQNTGNTPLYHGHHRLVSLVPTRTETVIIDLQQITNSIQVIVHDSDPSLRINIEDHNSRYNYQGEILPDDLLSYDPHNTYIDPLTNNYTAEFTVMRLQSTNKAHLKIFSSSGTLLYNEKLINGLLGANPTINFDTDHDFIIEITFDSNYVPMSILINGWEIILEDVN